MILEENVLQKAILSLDRDIFANIDNSKYFLNPLNKQIWKYILAIYESKSELSYDTIRQSINNNGHPHKPALHDKLKTIETETYFYMPDMINDLVKQYHENMVKKCGTKLQKIGTENCSMAEAKESIVYINEMFKNIEQEKKHFITLEPVKDKILNEPIEKLNDTLIEIKGEVMTKIFGPYFHA